MQDSNDKHRLNQRFVVRMTSLLHSALRDKALSNHRSLNSEIVHCLNESLSAATAPSPPTHEGKWFVWGGV